MSDSPVTARRQLGTTDLAVSPVALGCWPIAGVSTLDANEADSVATVQAALDEGINHLDTAYVYGANGESERVIAKALVGRRDQAVIATKGGVHFEGDSMAQDARPETLRDECEESLRRLDTDRVELLYLHSPDPEVPLEESAGALRELQQEGKAIAIGFSNGSLEEIQAFHSVCPLAAVQLPYNMLQRGIEEQSLPWCQENKVSAFTYWTFMKGLLADRLPKDGKLDPNDKRLTYPMYQGEEWDRNQEFLASLRQVAEQCDKTVAQLVVNWTSHRPGVTAVLCGAKRDWQIQETAAAMGWRLTKEQNEAIELALKQRGDAETSRNFS